MSVALLLTAIRYPGTAVGPDAPLISNHSTKMWDHVFRVNVYAPFWITRAAVPLLPPGSSIIFTASDVARDPLPGAVPYSATKAALANMVKSLAQQLQPLGIRVNGVAPGFAYTPFLNAQGYDTETFDVMKGR